MDPQAAININGTAQCIVQYLHLPIPIFPIMHETPPS